jgi:hypothetical protein
MNDFTPASFLFWIAVAVLVPALVVHFTLGRKGGHHLWDGNRLSPDEIRNLPFDMARKRTARSLKSSATAVIGLLLALALYRMLRGVVDVPQGKFLLCVGGAIVLVLVLGPVLHRKFQE